jgi:hypothetical protein
VFLSNAGQDNKDFCRYLWALLESLGVTVYLDQVEARPIDDPDFQKRIKGVLATCRMCIFVFSPSYLQTKYCRWELKTMKQRFDEEKDRTKFAVFAVFLPTLNEYTLQLDRRATGAG